METRANYTLIGAFTLAVVLGAFLFIFWFSGGPNKQAGRDQYRVVFTSSVSGLARGSQVLFNGLKVGEVVNIDLAPDPSEVFAVIEVDRRTPVKTDTRARLEYQGLTGVGSIALAGGSADAPRLEGKDGKVAEIRADRSDFQNIVETLQELTNKVDRVLGSADPQRIGHVIESLDRFVTTLDDNRDNVAAALKNAAELTAKLNSSAERLEAFLGGKKGEGGVFDEVTEAAQSLRRLASNLDQQTKEISAGVKNFTGPGLKQYEALALDARKTLDEINRTVRSLGKNPEQVIFGAKPSVPEYGR
jgi:phospholipid/cholesterol/gamma-HCH transport system substrate-binding protein